VAIPPIEHLIFSLTIKDTTMADEADLAFEVEQQSLNSAIAFQLKQKPRLHPKGECHYCDTTVSAQQLFCNSDCAAEWERVDKQLRAAGK
jgi:hypothetical protein